MTAPLTDAQFGVPLDVILERAYERNIPSLVKDLCFYLSKCFNVVGLFRVVPPLNVVEDAAKAINQRSSRFNFKSDNVHTVAALLRKFVADIPGGLFPALQSRQVLNSFGKLEEIKAVVNSLPNSHKTLLFALSSFLNAVSEHSAINQMSRKALADIWAPVMITLKDEDDQVSLMKASLALLTIMTNLKYIYEKVVKTHTLVANGEFNAVANQKRNVLALKAELSHRLHEFRSQIRFIEKQLEEAHSTEDVGDLVLKLRSARLELQNRLAKVELEAKVNNIPKMLSCKTRLQSGHFSLTGRRPTMEDRVIHLDDFNSYSPILTPNINRSLYAVFDGHAGDEIAILAEEHLPRYIIHALSDKERGHDVLACLNDAVHDADHFICAKANKENVKSGSTMVIVYIENEELYVANLGDSEAIMCQKTDQGTFDVTLISKKHKPEDQDEIDRMVSGGALVARGRVFGKLAVSRALGDSDFKIPKANVNHVSNDSYLKKFNLSPRNEFMILACDGLWDIVTYQQAIDLVAQERQKGSTPEKAAEKLAQTSYDGNSQDNISLIVVYFDWAPIVS